MFSESVYTLPREECPKPHYWSSADINATEFEVLDFIWGLVRLLQPDYVLETGTHRGFGAYAIGTALKQNGHGKLHTIEIDKSYEAEITERLDPVRDVVKVFYQDSLSFEPVDKVDFTWIDSSDAIQRQKEFARFRPYMTNNSIVAFHDTGTQHAAVRAGVDRMHERGDLIAVHLPTPRGISVCRVLPL